MIDWGLSEVQLLASFLAASAVLILIGLKLIIGPSPRLLGKQEPQIESNSPRPLAAVEQEGFQIVEIYEDDCALEDWLAKTPSLADASTVKNTVRTAKVRDPVSGEIKLISVLYRASSLH